MHRWERLSVFRTSEDGAGSMTRAEILWLRRQLFLIGKAIVPLW
jgi:hypothetical protein